MSEKKNKRGLAVHKIIELENEFRLHKQKIDIINKQVEEKNLRLKNSLIQFFNDTVFGINDEMEIIESLLQGVDSEDIEKIKPSLKKIKEIINATNDWTKKVIVEA